MNHNANKSAAFEKLASAILIAATVWIVIRYFSFILIPLGLGWMTAYFLQRPVKYLENRLGVGRGFSAFVLVSVTVILTVGIVAFAAAKLIGEIRGLTGSFADAWNSLKTVCEGLAKNIDGAIGTDLARKLPAIITDLIASAASGIPGVLADAVKSLPSVFIAFVIFAMSALSFAVSFDKRNRSLLEFLPGRGAEVASLMKHSLAGACANYVKAYSFIFILSFAQLYLWLTLLGADYAFSAAFFIALADVIPFLGSGAVVIPWAALSFLLGRASFGAGLLVMFLVMTVIRQIAEPKVVGNFIGLDPLLSLVSACVGLKVMGFFGVFVFPIVTSIALDIRERAKADKVRSSESGDIGNIIATSKPDVNNSRGDRSCIEGKNLQKE